LRRIEEQRVASRSRYVHIEHSAVRRVGR
jgi:hypothetical protein